MKTSVRRSMVLLTSAALALAVSVFAPTATLSSASAQPTTDVWTLIDNLGRTYYRSIYGGMATPGNGAEIDVYLTKLDPQVEAAFSALSPSQGW